MKNIAIILLAGDSTRFKSDTPKQLYKINGKPLCYYSLKMFYESKLIDEVVIVSKDEYFAELKKYIGDKKTHFVKGGNSRFESVDNAINYLKDKIDDNDNVLVHDGARILLIEELLKNLIDALKDSKAATLAIPLEDTIGELDGTNIKSFPNRNGFVKIQTPQAFKFKTIKDAHKVKIVAATDDAQLCLKINEKVKYVLGDKSLNKITTIEDIVNLEKYLGK